MEDNLQNAELLDPSKQSETSTFADNEVSALYNGNTKVTKISVGSTRGSYNLDRDSGGGWTIPLVLAGLTCCLGSALPAGYNIGDMNNASPLMKNFCNTSFFQRYGEEISEGNLKLLWSTIVSIFLIGGVCGSLSASYIADRWSRRGALISGHITGVLGSICFALIPSANSIELFLLGRFLVGLSGGLATSVVPMYMTEIAPLNLRGAVGVLCQLGITCGVLLGQIAGLKSVLGTVNSWHIMLAAFAPLCVIALVTTIFLPESPKYLYIIKEQKEVAFETLRRIRKMDIMLLEKEIKELENERSRQMANDKWSIIRVFKDPTVRLPLMLVMALQFGQQLSGINAVFYYSNIIFEQAGLSEETAQYATIGTGLANVGLALISFRLNSIFGRRTLFLSSCYSAVVCLLVLCISINLINVAKVWMAWICIIATIAFVVFYGIGLGPIPYFIGSELFNVGPRPAAMAIGSVFNWGGNFVVGMTFEQLLGIIREFSFLIFAALIIMLALFTRVYLPETKGRSTVEVADTMTEGLQSRPNARTDSS